MARLALAALSGVLCFATYEPTGLWWLGAPGIALLIVALSPWSKSSGPTMLGGAAIAFTQSAVMFGLLLPWIGELVGTVPYVALTITEALYALIFGAGAVALIRRGVAGVVGTVFLAAAVEWLRCVWPFGGFPWGRLAWGQVSGPFAFLTPLAGPAGVSAAVTVAGVAVALIVSTTLPRSRRIPAAVGCVLVLVGAAIATVAANPTINEAPAAQVTVAAVQGNVPRLGLDFNAQRRAVLNNHARVTESLIHQPVDLVIWPENSSDVNPFADANAMSTITTAVKKVHAPILVGTLTHDKVGDRNTMVVFDPRTGQGDWHNKKYLQPFGEWMPYRDLLRHVSHFVDLAGDFKPGDGTGVVRMRAATTGKMVPVGVTTCYEVAFDDAGRDAVKNGAQILAVPTNNATFGFSNMTYQQLAMSRMRAMELHRSTIVAATSGVSAIITPDGHVVEKTRIFTPAALVKTLPLETVVTSAVRWGGTFETVMVIIGWLSLLAAAIDAAAWLRHRRNRKA